MCISKLLLMLLAAVLLVSCHRAEDLSPVRLDYTHTLSVEDQLETSSKNADPDGSTFVPVSYISQGYVLPNGCEAVSATILLEWAGVEITASDFVDNYLTTDVIYREYGILYGPDPNEAYAGNPYLAESGIGCFAPVITDALNRALPEGCRAVNTTGMTLEELRTEYILAGIPVAVWVTLEMSEINEMLEWYSYDGTEVYQYPVNEHCMVFVGSLGDKYIFADPSPECGYMLYPKEACNVAFEALGLQSVMIIK